MSDSGVGPGVWRRFRDWQKVVNARQWAFLCGRADAAYARKWGLILAVAPAAVFAVRAAAAAFGFMPADKLLLLVAAGLYLVLGALAGRGKTWASPALMALWAAGLGFVIFAASGMPPVRWSERPGYWLWEAVVMALSSAGWMRVYYVIWRVERRQGMPLPGGGKR